MNIIISEDKVQLGQQAAEQGAELLRETLSARGDARLIVATGASQFETLAHLVTLPGIDWANVTIFHLDEYAGMAESHPASFRKYLKERFLAKLPQAPKSFHFVNGEGDLKAECDRLGALISESPIDVAFVGIGENGHLAFNDPPADFETEEPYLVVNLDEACRKQQLGEGWFGSLEEVPQQAISMSIQQILKAKAIIASVPDERKAEAVASSLEGPISPLAPSSILQQHADTTIHLDPASASKLSKAAV